MKKHIPNSITCCNLICGCIAIHFAMGGALPLALLFIVLGAVFDFFDGFTARLLGVSSPIGKELDSLADVVTFGVAPASMAFTLLGNISCSAGGRCPMAPYFPYAAFLIAAFSALRLAKFNLDTRQSHSFIGLPTPANALFWGSLLVGIGEQMYYRPWTLYLILIGILVSSWLLVSEIPMFALKFKHWGVKGNEVKYLFLVTCVPLVAIFGITSFAIIVAWYVVLSMIVKQQTSKS